MTPLRVCSGRFGRASRHCTGARALHRIDAATYFSRPAPDWRRRRWSLKAHLPVHGIRAKERQTDPASRAFWAASYISFDHTRHGPSREGLVAQQLGAVGMVSTSVE